MNYKDTNNSKYGDWDDQKHEQSDSLNAPFWMVVRIGNSGYNKGDATPTVHHATYEDAHAEANRLARKHPHHLRGFAVVKTECVIRGVVSAIEITWESIKTAKGEKA
jgi:hypothetical protein